MFNSQKPNIEDLPTKRQLLISTIIALIVSIILLITVVLPSEYGVDITGIGSAIGLKKMGEIKTSLTKEDKLTKKETSTNTIIEDTLAENKLKYEIKPGQAIEVKLVMDKDSKVNYKWSSSNGSLNYDLHGDSKNKDFVSYKKGRASSLDKGVLRAKFNGNHGWWWKNIGNEALVLTLEISGDYKEIKKVL